MKNEAEIDHGFEYAKRVGVKTIVGVPNYEFLPYVDIGHDLHNGCDPVADLKKYYARVFDMHIKDVTDVSKAGRGIEIGRGKIDFPALVRMMREVNYTGMCSLEFEKDMKDPFLGIAESIGYFKAVSELA